MGPEMQLGLEMMSGLERRQYIPEYLPAKHLGHSYTVNFPAHLRKKNSQRPDLVLNLVPDLVSDLAFEMQAL